MATETPVLTSTTMEVNGYSRMPGDKVSVELVAPGSMGGTAPPPPPEHGWLLVPHRILMDPPAPPAGTLVEITYRLAPSADD